MKNDGVVFNNLDRPKNIYSKRFQKMWHLPDNKEETINKKRKQLISKLCKKNNTVKDNPNGHEILYGVVKQDLVYDFLIINQDNLMDEEVEPLLKWMDDYWNQLYDSLIDLISEILPGLGKNFII